MKTLLVTLENQKGSLIEMTAEEVSKIETDYINETARKKTEEPEATAKATAKANAKASGNTKLLALGLSQEEATALTGYTPE